jgi:DNA-binding NarL/FixJ family response regulator
MEKIRLLLADDHRIFLDGLRLLIGQMPDARILAAVQSGKEVTQVLSQQTCDVAILDIHMPLMDGVATTGWIKAHSPHTQVLILTAEQDAGQLEAVLKAGASGCIMKSAASQELIRAIRQIHAGNIFLSRKLLSAELPPEPSPDYSAENPAATRAMPLTEPFTRREVEILQLVAQGFNSTEIAGKLFIASSTVDTHRRNMLKKSGAKNVATLIGTALKHGLI